MEYNASEHHTDQEYLEFTRWLKDHTAESLISARGNADAVKQAITDYLEKGYSSYLTSGQLVDYFCVSTPSILDMAGFSEEEAEAAVELYDVINPELFAKYYPDNP